MPNRIDRSFLVTFVGEFDGTGRGTGGFGLVSQDGCVILDRLDSTGLCWSNGLLYRVVRPLKAIAVYGLNGLRYLARVDEAVDPHDILATHEAVYVVSTSTNELIRFNKDWAVVERWSPGGCGDAWHMNCLARDEKGSLILSAFGVFGCHREWKGNTLGRGILYDVGSDSIVYEGLSGPHNPRYEPDGLYICDSHCNALLVERDQGRRTVEFEGFTRGLLLDADLIFVGVNAERGVDGANARIAVLDRFSLKPIGSIPTPYPEIYDIVSVPTEMAEEVCSRPACFDVAQFVNLDGQLVSRVDELGKKLDLASLHLSTAMNSPLLWGSAEFIRRLARRLRPS